MPVTYNKIASVTVGSGGAATIDFQSIPATYDDLILKFSGRDTATSNFNDSKLTFNNSATGYTNRLLSGSGSAAASSTPGTTFITVIANDGSSQTASTFSNVEIYVPNYAGSSNKSVSIDAVSENNATQAFQYLVAGLWSNSAAINRITLTPGTTNYAEFSTATLYGIKKS